MGIVSFETTMELVFLHLGARTDFFPPTVGGVARLVEDMPSADKSGEDGSVVILENQIRRLSLNRIRFSGNV